MVHFYKISTFEKSFICAERQTNRQTDKHTDRQTDKQTDKHPQSCSENKPPANLKKRLPPAIMGDYS